MLVDVETESEKLDFPKYGRIGLCNPYIRYYYLVIIYILSETDAYIPASVPIHNQL